MSRVLVAPSAGQPISASFVAELLREVRANRPLAGKNVRTSRTPNGTHISAVGAAEPRAAKKANDVGCFAIGVKDKEDPGDDDVYVFKNPYYRVGGKTHSVDGKDWIDAILDEDKIVALKLSMNEDEPNARIVSYDNFHEMQADEQSELHIVIPLYWFGSKNSAEQAVPPVICDFRIGMPSISAEFGEVNT